MSKKKTKKAVHSRQPEPQHSSIKIRYRVGALVLVSVIIISMIAMYAF